MTAAPGSLQIQPLVEADLPTLLRLFSQLQREDVPIAFERATAIWRTIAADDAYAYLGGFMDGALVSTCNAVIVPNLTRGGRPYALIEGVITEEAWRRRGIGRAVLGELLERCWARDCYKVMLMSGLTRAGAHTFYEAIGFDRNAKHAFVIRRP